MKKVSFKNLNLNMNEVLSRQDMKKIKGGYFGGGGGSCNFTVTCIMNPGYNAPGGSCSGSPDQNGDCFPAEQECYNQANAWCSDPNNHCDGCAVG